MLIKQNKNTFLSTFWDALRRASKEGVGGSEFLTAYGRYEWLYEEGRTP